MESIKRKNEIVYRESFYLDGKRIKSPHFKRKTDAKTWKMQFLSDREKAKIYGDNFKVPVKITFEEYFKEWSEKKLKVQRSLSTYRNYEAIFRIHILPLFGKLQLSEFSPAHADQLIKKLLDENYRPKGINNMIQSVKAMLNDAEKRDVIRRNQLRGFRDLKVPKLPPHYWGQMEIRQFFQESVNDQLYPLFVVAINTGMRRGELAGLCWDRIDFSRNMIEVSRIRDRYGLRATTKTGIARHVPMNEAVKTTLLRLSKTAKEKFVFLDKDRNPLEVHHLYREFAKVQKKVGMDQIIRFHDLRHCFASHFMMSGGNLYDLQRILGHTQYAMTQIYAHLSPDYLSGTTQILSFGKMSIEEEKSRPELVIL